MSNAPLIEIVAGAIFAHPDIGHVQEKVRAYYGKEVWITVSEDRVIVGAANSSGSAHCEIDMGDIRELDPALLWLIVRRRLAKCRHFISRL